MTVVLISSELPKSSASSRRTTQCLLMVQKQKSFLHRSLFEREVCSLCRSQLARMILSKWKISLHVNLRVRFLINVLILSTSHSFFKIMDEDQWFIRQWWHWDQSAELGRCYYHHHTLVVARESRLWNPCPEKSRNTDTWWLRSWEAGQRRLYHLQGSRKSVSRAFLAPQ